MPTKGQHSPPIPAFNLLIDSSSCLVDLAQTKNIPRAWSMVWRFGKQDISNVRSSVVSIPWKEVKAFLVVLAPQVHEPSDQDLKTTKSNKCSSRMWNNLVAHVQRNIVLSATSKSFSYPQSYLHTRLTVSTSSFLDNPKLAFCYLKLRNKSRII